MKMLIDGMEEKTEKAERKAEVLRLNGTVNAVENGCDRNDWSVVKQMCDCDWLLGNHISRLIDCQ